MSEYKTLQLISRSAEGYAELILNRPEHRNAYTLAMGEELVAAFTRLREDDTVRAVIFTGAGHIFCAGIDLSLLRRHATAAHDGPALGEEYFIRGFSRELFAFPKPVIAAVNGAAVGIGVTMLLPVDIRLAARSASFSLPFARLGILPGLGSAYLLPKLVGAATAREWLYTGRAIDAEEAAAAGLVNQVVDDAALLDVARRLAAAIAATEPEVIRATKQLINRGSALHSIEESLLLERELSDGLKKK